METGKVVSLSWNLLSMCHKKGQTLSNSVMCTRCTVCAGCDVVVVVVVVAVFDDEIFVELVVDEVLVALLVLDVIMVFDDEVLVGLLALE
eukprot:4879154-Amphidinium_carterae.1